MNIRGVGYEFWVDRDAGYGEDEQLALIEFLLALRHDPNSPRAKGALPTAPTATIEEESAPSADAPREPPATK